MRHGLETSNDLLPSMHLDVEVSREQRSLFNPSPRVVQLAAILEQYQGKGAMRKISTRRMDIMQNNVRSYARVLNDPAQLNKIKDFNELSASLAAYSREVEAGKSKSKAEKEEKEAKLKTKREEAAKKAKEERKTLAPGCKKDVEAGLEFVLGLTAPRKKQILK